MKKSLIVILSILLTILPASAKRLYPEKEYQVYWCNKRGGIMEYKIKNAGGTFCRVDCLLPDLAVEFDFANKHAECLGQAQEYAAITRRKGACVLIVESGQDWKYVKRLRNTVYKKKLGIKTFTIRPEQVFKN